MALRKQDDPIVQPELYDEFGDYKFKWMQPHNIYLIHSEVEGCKAGSYKHHLGTLRWTYKADSLNRMRVMVILFSYDESYGAQHSQGYPKRSMEKIAIADRANMLLREYIRYREEQVDA